MFSLFFGKCIVLFSKQNNFFPMFCSTIAEWNKLDINSRNSKSWSVFFKKVLPKCVLPTPHGTFDCNNPKAVTFNTRPTLNLGHLPSDLFQHRFQDNPFGNCESDVEKSTLFTLVHWILTWKADSLDQSQKYSLRF